MVNVVGFLSTRIGRWASCKCEHVAYLRLNFNLAVKSELFDGRVEEKDEREGRRENRVVVEILPPDTRPSILIYSAFRKRAKGIAKLPEKLPLYICISYNSVVGVHHPGSQHARKEVSFSALLILVCEPQKYNENDELVHCPENVACHIRNLK